MLYNLNKLFGPNVGQTSLNTKQTEIINKFNADNGHTVFDKLIRHRLDLRVPNNYENVIIKNYEDNNKNKTFSISGKNSVLISPHEYLAAERYSATKKSKSINLTFVGGCFPVQQDILFEDLFHQKLKRRIESKSDKEFNINIIRYENFNTCLKKIIRYNESFPIDVLVFHVRPEPFLRLVKIYYRYLTHKGKIKRSINIPSLNISDAENNDSLKYEKSIIIDIRKKDTFIHKLFVDLNYIIGQRMGNLKYAFKKYYELTIDIVKYCKQKNIQLLVLGIGYRNNTPYARKLCRQYNSYLQNKYANNNICYIENMKQISENIVQYFQNDGIHASNKYHELIAELLYNKLRETMIELM